MCTNHWLKARAVHTVQALAHYKDFHKDFSEKIFVKIVVHKTVEKIVAVVKKSGSVYGG